MSYEDLSIKDWIYVIAIFTFIPLVIIGICGTEWSICNHIKNDKYDNITILSKDNNLDGSGLSHYSTTFKTEKNEIVTYEGWSNCYYVYKSVEVNKTYYVEYQPVSFSDDNSRSIKKINNVSVESTH